VRALELIFAAIMLAGSIYGLARALQRRRRASRAAAEPSEAPPMLEADVAATLVDAGFSTPTRDARGAVGASAVLDGVTIQAVATRERGHDVFALAVPHPEGLRRLRVSATAQGMRRARKALVLGLAHVDLRLDVLGDTTDARALFGRAGAEVIVKAITSRGWQLEDGRLVHPGLTHDHLRAAALAGAAAAQVLHRDR